MKLGSRVFTPSCEYDATGEYSRDDCIYWKLWLNFHLRTSTLINESARDWIIGQGHSLAWVSMKRPTVTTKRLATTTERLAATIKRAATRSPAWSHVAVIEHTHPFYTTPPHLPCLRTTHTYLSHLAPFGIKCWTTGSKSTVRTLLLGFSMAEMLTILSWLVDT